MRVLLVLAFACGVPQRPAVQHHLPADLAARYHGQVVVLDFWASWCKECKTSVPAVSRLALTFARDGLVVVGVNAGDQPAEVPGFARELGIDYPVENDPDLALSDRLGAASLPALLVVDRNGTIVHRARRVDPETIAVVRRLLGDGDLSPRAHAAPDPAAP